MVASIPDTGAPWAAPREPSRAEEALELLRERRAKLRAELEQIEDEIAWHEDFDASNGDE